MWLWQKLGQIAYWLSWPALWVYLRGTERTRLLLIAGDKILVVKTWLGNGKWVLPGGGIHKNEPPDIGVRREVREETGIDLRSAKLRILGNELYTRHRHKFRLHFFAAEMKDTSSPHPQFWEIVETQWIDYSQLNVRNADDNVLRALELWRH